MDDSEGILYLNSRGLARGKADKAVTDAVTHGNGIKRRIPEESFLIFDENGDIKKDSSGIHLSATQPWVTARGRPQGASLSRQPTAIQIKDSFGIVNGTYHNSVRNSFWTVYMAGLLSIRRKLSIRRNKWLRQPNNGYGLNNSQA